MREFKICRYFFCSSLDPCSQMYSKRISFFLSFVLNTNVKNVSWKQKIWFDVFFFSDNLRVLFLERWQSLFDEMDTLLYSIYIHTVYMHTVISNYSASRLSNSAPPGTWGLEIDADVQRRFSLHCRSPTRPSVCPSFVWKNRYRISPDTHRSGCVLPLRRTCMVPTQNQSHFCAYALCKSYVHFRLTNLIDSKWWER